MSQRQEPAHEPHVQRAGHRLEHVLLRGTRVLEETLPTLPHLCRYTQLKYCASARYLPLKFEVQHEAC